MEVKYGTYHLGSKIIHLSTDLSEQQLRSILKEEPRMERFIKLKADDNNKEESIDAVEVVAESVKPKQRRKRKS